MYKSKTYLFLAALFFLLKPAGMLAQTNIVAEKLPMRQLTVDDGLSQGFVFNGLQDKKGFLWFATMDGLNRYDGYTFTVFRHDPDNPWSLPGNAVSSVAEDGLGNLWVGTLNKGLCLFDLETERAYKITLTSPLVPDSNYSVFNLAVIGQLLYIKTDKGIIVVRFADAAKIKTGEVKPGTPIQVVESIPINSEFTYPLEVRDNVIAYIGYGSLYINQPDRSLNHWSTLKLSAAELGLGKLDYKTRAVLAPDSKGFYIIQDGNIFFYDLAGRRRLLKGSFPKLAILEAKLIDSNIYFTCEITSYKSTLFGFNCSTDSLIRYDAKNDGRILAAMFSDRSGSLWLRTDAKGVLLLNRQIAAFKTITAYNLGIVLTKTGLLNHINNDVCEYHLSTGVNEKIISAADLGTTGLRDFFLIARDNSHTFWRTGSGTSESSILYSYDTRSRKLSRHDLGFNSIRYLFIDNNNLPWVLHRSDSGLQVNRFANLDSAGRHIKRTYEIPFHAVSVERGFVKAVWQDPKGIMWMTSDNGLFALDPTQSDEKKSWRHWMNIPGDNSSLSGDNLTTVCPDPREPQHYLWLGTRGAGFNRFDMNTGKCVRYGEKDGLPNNVVYDIMPDKFGNLWISTNMGLSCFTIPSDQTKKGVFRNFTAEDGLAGNEFNELTGRRSLAGELSFTGIDGTTIFDPAQILQQLDTMPIRFTALSINNKVLNWEANPAVIPGNIAYYQQINLSHDENFFTISFSTIDYRNTKGKLYSWRLEGFEKEWTEPSTQHSVTYTNLDPGTYYFHVKGTNCDGVWNEKGSVLKIVIKPAWYQTWLFKIALLLLIMGSFYAFYRYRLKQQVKLLKVRNNIATDLHDEIGSTLSSVSISSTIIQQKLEAGNSDVHGLLDQISTNTDNMMEAMSDIVWAINSKNDRFDNVINRMRAFAIEILEPKHCTLHFTTDDELEALTLDMNQRKNLYLLYKEAINNAAKYSGCKNLWVNISKDRGRKILLSIKDDGTGFNPPSSDKVQPAVLGGNGLNNMQQRAAELGGTLKIHSTPGKGTEVVLEFAV